MKSDFFPSWGHFWVLQICWHIECSTVIASTFMIWNSSTGIPSSPLVLFVVTLPKAHLTSHSRMSDSRWVNTPSWLSKALRPIFYSSSVYSCHLSLISSASVRSLPLLSFILPILAWNVPWYVQFSRRDLYSFPLSFPFCCFRQLLCIVHLRRSYLSAILWNSAFSWAYPSLSCLLFASLPSSAICKASSDNHFAFLCFFSWGWFWSLLPVQC